MMIVAAHPSFVYNLLCHHTSQSQFALILIVPLRCAPPPPDILMITVSTSTSGVGRISCISKQATALVAVQLFIINPKTKDQLV